MNGIESSSNLSLPFLKKEGCDNDPEEFKSEIHADTDKRVGTCIALSSLKHHMPLYL